MFINYKTINSQPTILQDKYKRIDLKPLLYYKRVFNYSVVAIMNQFGRTNHIVFNAEQLDYFFTHHKDLPTDDEDKEPSEEFLKQRCLERKCRVRMSFLNICPRYIRYAHKTMNILNNPIEQKIHQARINFELEKKAIELYNYKEVDEKLRNHTKYKRKEQLSLMRYHKMMRKKRRKILTILNFTGPPTDPKCLVENFDDDTGAAAAHDQSSSPRFADIASTESLDIVHESADTPTLVYDVNNPTFVVGSNGIIKSVSQNSSEPPATYSQFDPPASSSQQV